MGLLSNLSIIFLIVLSLENEGRTHLCKECNKSFKRGYHLQRHMDTVHKKRRAFKCPSCNFSATRKDSLDRHINQIHTQEKIFYCNECGKHFKQSGNLLRHKETVHLKKKYECPHCRLFYSRKDSLERHMSSLHK